VITAVGAEAGDGTLLAVITAVGAEAGDGTFGRILVHSNKDANHLS
jgi:hypothetical protein